MSLLDKLKKAWAESSKDVADQARDAAAELAVRQAAAAARKAVEAVGDELVGDLEAGLAREEAARRGRADVRPDGQAAEQIAARIEGQADAAQAARTRRAEREQKAREELARLKAEMDAAKAQAQARDPDDILPPEES